MLKTLQVAYLAQLGSLAFGTSNVMEKVPLVGADDWFVKDYTFGRGNKLFWKAEWTSEKTMSARIAWSLAEGEEDDLTLDFDFNNFDQGYVTFSAENKAINMSDYTYIYKGRGGYANLGRETDAYASADNCLGHECSSQFEKSDFWRDSSLAQETEVSFEVGFTYDQYWRSQDEKGVFMLFVDLDSLSAKGVFWYRTRNYFSGDEEPIAQWTWDFSDAYEKWNFPEADWGESDTSYWRDLWRQESSTALIATPSADTSRNAAANYCTAVAIAAGAGLSLALCAFARSSGSSKREELIECLL